MKYLILNCPWGPYIQRAPESQKYIYQKPYNAFDQQSIKRARENQKHLSLAVFDVPWFFDLEFIQGASKFYENQGRFRR